MRVQNLFYRGDGSCLARYLFMEKKENMVKKTAKKTAKKTETKTKKK